MGGRGSSGSGSSGGRGGAARRNAGASFPVSLGGGIASHVTPDGHVFYQVKGMPGGGFWDDPANAPHWFSDPSTPGGGYYMDPWGNTWNSGGRATIGGTRGSAYDPAANAANNLSAAAAYFKHPELFLGRSPYPKGGAWPRATNPVAGLKDALGKLGNAFSRSPKHPPGFRAPPIQPPKKP